MSTAAAGIIGTVFAIIFAGHMLACVWYATGANDSQDACNGPRNATYVGAENASIENASHFSTQKR